MCRDHADSLILDVAGNAVISEGTDALRNDTDDGEQWELATASQGAARRYQF